jgi:hypothetical protein
MALSDGEQVLALISMYLSAGLNKRSPLSLTSPAEKLHLPPWVVAVRTLTLRCGTPS